MALSQGVQCGRSAGNLRGWGVAAHVARPRSCRRGAGMAHDLRVMLRDL